MTDTLVTALVFLVCLATTLAASELLVRGLDRLGAGFGLTEGLLGLLTALGADAPEISSALAAIHEHARDIGLGVVLGSNIFNLAALLGLGALLAGHVRVHREGLLLDGGVAALVTIIAAALVIGWLSAVLAAVLLLALFVPYVLILGTRPRELASLSLPGEAAHVLSVAASEVDHEAAEDPRVSEAGGSWWPVWLLPLALALIVAGSAGMVSTAVTLAHTWRVPQRLVGTIVLADLTSLPNAYAAARLALQGRGAAVVSETLNSNTLNLLAGLVLPAVLLGAGGSQGGLDLLWLSAMTLLTLVLLRRASGLNRAGGSMLIVLYAAFVIVTVTTAT